MNSVKILHAVRSAITAIAELLVYKGAGHDDGGTEGPERGAKRRSAEGVGSWEGALAPPQWGLGA